MSTLSTIVALLLGIACVAWLRGPETVPDTTVALLGRGVRSELGSAVTREPRPLPVAHLDAEVQADLDPALGSNLDSDLHSKLGSDLARMARSLIGRVSRF